MPWPGPFQVPAMRPTAMRRSSRRQETPLGSEKDTGPVKGPEMPGPASPLIAPLPQASEEEVASFQAPLPTHFLPRFLILSLMCCFQVSPELVRSYQASSKFREKMLLQIPEGQPPPEVNLRPQHSTSHHPRGPRAGWKMGGRWAAPAMALPQGPTPAAPRPRGPCPGACRTGEQEPCAVKGAWLRTGQNLGSNHHSPSRKQMRDSGSLLISRPMKNSEPKSSVGTKAPYFGNPTS